MEILSFAEYVNSSSAFQNSEKNHGLGLGFTRSTVSWAQAKSPLIPRLLRPYMDCHTTVTFWVLGISITSEPVSSNTPNSGYFPSPNVHDYWSVAASVFGEG